MPVPPVAGGGHADERKADGAGESVVIGDADLDRSHVGTSELSLSSNVNDERGVDLGARDHVVGDLRKEVGVHEVTRCAVGLTLSLSLLLLNIKAIRKKPKELSILSCFLLKNSEEERGCRVSSIENKGSESVRGEADSECKLLWLRGGKPCPGGIPELHCRRCSV